VVFEHVWSCEVEKEKQRWIVDNFNPPALFNDITALANDVAFDVVSNTFAPVAPCDILIAGTSCKDASRLNMHHGERLNSVDAGSHSAGSTFQGLARLCRRMGCRCRLVLLENVVDLKRIDRQTGRSNLDGVRDALEVCGFRFHSKEFSASDMGLPQARVRLYMAGTRDAGGLVTSGGFASSVVDLIAERAEKVPLERFLLSGEDHFELMQAWWPEAFARPDSRIVASSGEKWESRHEDVWQREIPLLTLADVSTELSGNPWFALLPRRQQDLLLMRLCRIKHGSAPSVRAIALQVSLG